MVAGLAMLEQYIGPCALPRLSPCVVDLVSPGFSAIQHVNMYLVPLYREGDDSF